MFRQDQGKASAGTIIDYLVKRAKPVTLDIQREMVDQGLKLSATNAGREVQEELDKLKEQYEQEMSEIRHDMEEAIRTKDKEREEELRQYRKQVDRQMKAAAEQARQLEASREELRREMKEEHAREIAQLRTEVTKRQQELEQTSRENKERHDQLIKEVKDYKDRLDRSELKEGYHYKYQFVCPSCGTGWLYNQVPNTKYCNVCRKNY